MNLHRACACACKTARTRGAWCSSTLKRLKKPLLKVDENLDFPEIIPFNAFMKGA